jgi:hypothetical protein
MLMRTSLVLVLAAMGCGSKSEPPPPPVSPAAGMTAKMRSAKADVEAAQKAEEQRDDKLVEQAK